MLLRFRFGNHGSFRDEQELSLLADTSIREVDRGVTEVPGVGDVLRCAAIYGANASGKSNVMGAISFMSRAVSESHKEWKPEGGVPRNPFLLSPECERQPSLFEVDFVVSGVRYQYGFRVDSERVLEEWLYAFPVGRRRMWFERDCSRSEEFEFGPSFGGEKRTIESLTRPNSLFLSSAAQNNHDLVLPLYAWLTEVVGVATWSNETERRLHTTLMLKNERKARLVMRLLAHADLGITDVAVREKDVPKSILDAIAKMDPDFDMSSVPERIPEAYFTHRASDPDVSRPMDMELESQGTRTLFALAGPTIDVLEDGDVLFVDELGRSIHPSLAMELIRAVNHRPSSGGNGQLVFNTHDTNLLADSGQEGSLLRRDQIWFTEKGEDGASTLYPLTAFRPRRHENLERGYLQGRYGATPFLTPLGGIEEQQ